MHSDLAQRILRQVARHEMFRAGDGLGVGVSGGADSVALLRLLAELQSELGIRLAVLHFNHQLRGAESDADEAFVAALAAERGLPFFAGRADVNEAVREHGWNLEDAARRLRYGFFASAVRDGRVTRVAAAHTADDQAETVIARLLRGTGPAGLAAIYPVVRLDPSAESSQEPDETGENRQSVAIGELVRPLLDVRREELREYLARLGQSWREDASNLDTRRSRARIRHQILPLLQNEVAPAIVPNLVRLAEMAREDEAFWSAVMAERLGALVRRESGARNEGGVAIRCEDLLAPLPLAGEGLSRDARMAVARRMVRALVGEARGDCRDLSAQHVEQVLRLAASGSSGQRSDLPGVVVERSFEWLSFYPAARGLAHGEVSAEADLVGEDRLGREYSHLVELGPPGKDTVVAIPAIGRALRLKVIDWPSPQGETNDDSYALDRDLLRSPLILRSWRAGDSFRPAGRRSAHKLKHFLRVRRVGIRDRAGWPVLTSNGELVWARGLPVAAEFAPRNETRAGVVIAEEEI